MDKVIPAFYACYLLRSTVRHASLYVGSTPNPVRRLRQHNGDAKGGAVRTSKDSLRPWEMTCLVTGFPSKVAALQFEWAWQNTHLTRHISPTSRLMQAQRTVRISPKTGRPRTKRAARPRLSLTDRLANLHQLLQSSSFGRWPLKLTFYASDVFRVWETWVSQEPKQLPPRIEVTLDESSQNPNTTAVGNEATGIYALDVTYKGLRAHLEKSRALFTSPRECKICHDSLPADGAMSLVCPKDGCEVVNHVDCLASSFLEEGHDLIPTSGTCPGCGTKLQWVNLVKELSLRMRAPKEVDKILKVRKLQAIKSSSPVKGLSGKNIEFSEDNEEDDNDDDDEMDDAPIDDYWHEISDSSDNGDNKTQTRANLSVFSKATYKFAKYPEPVIDDSDWDEAEMVT